MLIYLTIILLLAFFYYHYDVSKAEKYKNVMYILACLAFICVAGLRYRIGFDTINYMTDFYGPYFPKLSEFRFSTDYGGEVLWVLINATAKSIGGGFYTVQFIQAIIVNVVVFWFLKKYSPRPFLAILLYFLFQWWNYCFEAMRESIAIAFYLFGLDALLSGKGLGRFYLRAWPAVFVHTFGFLVLLFPAIKYLKINKYLPFIVIGFIVFLVCVGDLVNNLLESMMGMQLDSDASSKMMKYMGDETYGEANLSIFGIISLFISRIIPIGCFAYVLHKNNKPETDVFIPYLIMYIFMVGLRIAIPIFFRFFNYFEVMLIIAITQAIDISPKKSFNRLLSVGMMGMMILIRSYELTKPEGPSRAYNRYIPYNSVFTEDYNECSESIFRFY